VHALEERSSELSSKSRDADMCPHLFPTRDLHDDASQDAARLPLAAASVSSLQQVLMLQRYLNSKDALLFWVPSLLCLTGSTFSQLQFMYECINAAVSSFCHVYPLIPPYTFLYF